MQFIDKMEHYPSAFLRHILGWAGHETFMQSELSASILSLSWEPEKSKIQFCGEELTCSNLHPRHQSHYGIPALFPLAISTLLPYISDLTKNQSQPSKTNNNKKEANKPPSLQQTQNFLYKKFLFFLNKPRCSWFQILHFV